VDFLWYLVGLNTGDLESETLLNLSPVARLVIWALTSGWGESMG